MRWISRPGQPVEFPMLPRSPWARLRLALVLVLLLLSAWALPGRLASAADPDLRGDWVAAADGARVEVTFGADGSVTIVERGPAGVTLTRGRYTVAGDVLTVTSNDGEVLRYGFALRDGVLHVRDPDGTRLEFRRVGTAAAPVEKPPACARITTYVQWIQHDPGLRDPATGRPCEAFRLWIPEGWRASGGVRWKLDAKTVQTIERSDLVSPAVIEFSVVHPQGDAAITAYPGEPFADLTGAPAAPLFPRGSQYGGMTVCPVLGPGAFVKEILLPRYFQGVQDLQVVAYQDMPALAAQFQDEAERFNRVAQAAGIAQLVFRAGMTTVEFVAGGRAYREIFVTAPMALRMQGISLWFPRMAWSLRMRKDCAQALLPSLLTSICSFRLHPTWFLLYQRIVDSNWRGVAAVDATIRGIDEEIVRSRAKTASLIHRQLYPVLTGMATKSAPGYAPLPLDALKNHAVDPEGRLRELPDGQGFDDLPPGWLPLKPVEVK